MNLLSVVFISVWAWVCVCRRKKYTKNWTCAAWDEEGKWGDRLRDMWRNMKEKSSQEHHGMQKREGKNPFAFSINIVFRIYLYNIWVVEEIYRDI